MTDDRLGAVAGLSRAHLQEPFPSRLRGVDFDGVDLVLLDADVAGCVSTWLDSNGIMDDRRRRVLTVCRDRLSRILQYLDGDDAAYCRRLQDMAVLILDTSGESATGVEP